MCDIAHELSFCEFRDAANELWCCWACEKLTGGGVLDVAWELRQLEYWMSARCQKLRCDRAPNVQEELSCCGLRDCEELTCPGYQMSLRA